MQIGENPLPTQSDERAIAVLKGLVNMAPVLIARRFNATCCIAATKIAMGVLDRLGFDTQAQPTMFVVYNEKLWKRRLQWDGKFREGEWSVAIGNPKFRSLTKGYNAHLICLASFKDSNRYLVDLSVGQASRPQHAIHLPPGWFGMFTGWPVEVTDGKAVATYTQLVNPEFVRSPDWTEENRTNDIVETLADILWQELDAGSITRPLKTTGDGKSQE
jgi:hypothetical protein